MPNVIVFTEGDTPTSAEQALAKEFGTDRFQRADATSAGDWTEIGVACTLGVTVPDGYLPRPLSPE